MRSSREQRALRQLRQILVRQWQSTTQTLVIIAIALVVIAIIGIIGVILLHGFAPETAALVTAWATIVGVVIAQVINTRLAAERAQVEALQAYLQRMGELITEKQLRDPRKI